MIMPGEDMQASHNHGPAVWNGRCKVLVGFLARGFLLGSFCKCTFSTTCVSASAGNFQDDLAAQMTAAAKQLRARAYEANTCVVPSLSSVQSLLHSFLEPNSLPPSRSDIFAHLLERGLPKMKTAKRAALESPRDPTSFPAALSPRNAQSRGSQPDPAFDRSPSGDEERLHHRARHVSPEAGDARVEEGTGRNGDWPERMTAATQTERSMLSEGATASLSASRSAGRGVVREDHSSEVDRQTTERGDLHRGEPQSGTRVVAERGRKERSRAPSPSLERILEVKRRRVSESNVQRFLHGDPNSKVAVLSPDEAPREEERKSCVKRKRGSSRCRVRRQASSPTAGRRGTADHAPARRRPSTQPSDAVAAPRQAPATRPPSELLWSTKPPRTKIFFLKKFRIFSQEVYHSSHLDLLMSDFDSVFVQREYRLPEQDEGRFSDFTVFLSVPAPAGRPSAEMKEKELWLRDEAECRAFVRGENVLSRRSSSSSTSSSCEAEATSSHEGDESPFCNVSTPQSSSYATSSTVRTLEDFPQGRASTSSSTSSAGLSSPPAVRSLPSLSLDPPRPGGRSCFLHGEDLHVASIDLEQGCFLRSGSSSTASSPSVASPPASSTTGKFLVVGGDQGRTAARASNDPWEDTRVAVADDRAVAELAPLEDFLPRAASSSGQQQHGGFNIFDVVLRPSLVISTSTSTPLEQQALLMSSPSSLSGVSSTGRSSSSLPSLVTSPSGVQDRNGVSGAAVPLRRSGILSMGRAGTRTTRPASSSSSARRSSADVAANAGSFPLDEDQRAGAQDDSTRGRSRRPAWEFELGDHEVESEAAGSVVVDERGCKKSRKKKASARSSQTDSPKAIDRVFEQHSTAMIFYDKDLAHGFRGRVSDLDLDRGFFRVILSQKEASFTLQQACLTSKARASQQSKNQRNDTKVENAGNAHNPNYPVDEDDDDQHHSICGSVELCSHHKLKTVPGTKSDGDGTFGTSAGTNNKSTGTISMHWEIDFHLHEHAVYVVRHTTVASSELERIVAEQPGGEDTTEFLA
ncbi:unnamed protein product [Amoebophrya sp. A120]|nr:unnamed protein product [Amoebophrya sp. A120]|eukprot:GSA120T00024021001.1